jgi:signal transduction histidine kinase/CheY-like chemotaxis protein
MQRALTAWVRICAIAVALAATAVLSGYVLHRWQFITLLRGLQGMSVFSALGLLCLCGALLAETLQHSRAVAALAGAAVAIGVLILTLHGVTGVDWLSLHLERWLFSASAHAGQTSVATAACLAALGGSCLCRNRPWASNSLSALALITTGIALLGYAYGVDDLYAVYVFRTMALHTAAGLFVLALASLVVWPERGLASVFLSSGVGGSATRRQLAFMLVPPTVGFMLLRAIEAHRLGIAAAMAILVVCTIVPLCLLIVRDGYVLNELEEERRGRAAQQAAATLELNARLADQAEVLRRESADRASAEQSLARAQRMETIGQLTGGIAHDFNNLLMAIGGNLQLLLKRLASEHPARRFAVNAQGAIQRGAKLTAQLLTFSRTQKLHIRATRIDAVLASTRDLMGPTLGPHITVHSRLGAADAWALADSDQLELAILNLGLNARDAMPGGGELFIESGERRTRLTAEEEDKSFVSIRVRDTGVGMNAAVAAKAIEPFFTTKERGQGSGLGLAQAYGFVRQCGGDLVIDSEPGRGTTVELLLPATAAPIAGQSFAETAESMPEHPRADHRLLLVIDDDDLVRGVIVEALRDGGFSVIEAPDGATGLELLEKHEPAAAIIDFLMPGLNGADVARRAQVRRPDLPIIFVSGYYDTMALDAISGAVVLRKPVDMAQLMRTISSVVAES